MKANAAADVSGTPLQKAIVWLSDEIKRDPSQKIFTLVDQASLRFNLSPQEGDTLTQQLGKIRAEIRAEKQT